MIYPINTDNNVMFPVIKSAFELSEEEVHIMTKEELHKYIEESKGSEIVMCLILDVLIIFLLITNIARYISRKNVINKG